MTAQTAKERFEATRKAIERLADVQALLMTDGEDWQPPTIGKVGNSDPTASRAIRNVDELADKLEALRQEEHELLDTIGESLAIIEGVRAGFGEIYANLLEWRYIDGWTWQRIVDDKGIKRTTGHNLLDIAFDWIDSVGISKILRGVLEV